MIEKPVKVTKIRCMECGMIIPTSNEGEKPIACPKCGGKVFEITNKTEVITK